jgi:hypothetical protein
MPGFFSVQLSSHPDLPELMQLKRHMPHDMHAEAAAASSQALNLSPRQHDALLLDPLLLEPLLPEPLLLEPLLPEPLLPEALAADAAAA